MEVILVTHYFPPIGGPAARRMVGWCKGWLQLGMSVTVLTAKADAIDPYYEADAKQVDGVRLIEVPIFDPARLMRQKSSSNAVSSISGNGRNSLGARVRPWLLLPDQRRLANIPLRRSLGKLLEKSAEPKLLITTSPYNSTHLIGLHASRTSRQKNVWFADFRDDWFHPYFFPFPTQAHRTMNRYWEGQVMKNADRLITVNDTIRGKMTRRHNGLVEDERWIIIPNGFEPIPFPPPRQEGKPALQILYPGTLWPNQSLAHLVTALHTVASEAGTDIIFELAGRQTGAIPVAPVNSRLRIEVTPWVSHDAILARMAAADLLVVHAGTEIEVMTAKVFDCARSGRPVLVLGPGDSEVSRFTRQNVQQPLVADANDEPGITDGLRAWLTTEDRSRFCFGPLPEEYDRYKQARKLLTIGRALSENNRAMSKGAL